LSPRRAHDSAASFFRQREHVGSRELPFDGALTLRYLRLEIRTLLPADGQIRQRF
jgi:hypothetical protein